jgi:hypothetical protein
MLAKKMKFTDDYSAKVRLWIDRSEVVSVPRISGIPKFSAKKFSSHKEMNAWKKDLIKQIAAQGGCQWTS